MTRTMFDAVTISNIPSDATAVAGYVGGHFPTFSNLVARFPQAKHLSIAVNASEDAECLDIENGDARPSEAPAWHVRQVSRGVKRPVFYANTSTMPSVVAELTAAKIPRSAYRLWTAHYTGQPHIEPGSDATQWTDKALGRELDQSLCADDFFTDPVARQAVNPPHYEWFATGPFLMGAFRLDEQAVVRVYDKYRALQTPSSHPYQTRLALLRLQLNFLAKRVAHVAIDLQPLDDGSPSWGVDHRGWRYQQLTHRAQGQRFV